LLYLGPLLHLATSHAARDSHPTFAAIRQALDGGCSGGGAAAVRLQLLRDLMIAPAAEEWVFRACMVPLLWLAVSWVEQVSAHLLLLPRRLSSRSFPVCPTTLLQIALCCNQSCMWARWCCCEPPLSALKHAAPLPPIPQTGRPASRHHPVHAAVLCQRPPASSEGADARAGICNEPGDCRGAWLRARENQWYAKGETRIPQARLQQLSIDLTQEQEGGQDIRTDGSAVWAAQKGNYGCLLQQHARSDRAPRHPSHTDRGPRRPHQLQVLFQFVYTTMFGWLATWIFLSTGHALAPVLVHAACNALGVPPFAEMGALRLRGMPVLLVATAAGVVLFWRLSGLLLHPGLYGGHVYAMAG
jgi:hypothetical protein